MLFQQYRMALNQEKYDIEVQNDDAIKRNQILFDFIQQTFNSLDGLYLREICILIYMIIKDKFRNHSVVEIEILNKEKKERNKRKENTYKPSPKTIVNKITRTSRATSNTSNSNINDNIPQLSESISSEDEEIGMSKCRRKINVEIINVEVKVSSSEA